MKICFIVGHGKSASGGYDSGAVCGNYHEFKIAKEIAKYAYEYYVENYGEADLMNYKGDLYLSNRIKKANLKKYDFVAEIHLNAGKGYGSEVYYAKASSKGKEIAAAISESISLALGIKNRGAKIKLGNNGDYFGIIRQTNMEAVLIETAFIDTTDLNTIKTAEGQKKCGIAIAQAIAKTLNVKKNYFAKCGSDFVSIVDALKSIGEKSSYSYRASIAKANGVSAYVGTAKQNAALLTLLKQGKLIKP